MNKIQSVIDWLLVFFAGGKGNYFEGGLRVPAIVHWPGVIAPRTVSASVGSLMDILPTFREIAGTDPNPTGVFLDGKSLHHVLFDDPNAGHHETLLFFCDDLLVAARHKKYKIHFAVANPFEKKRYEEICKHGIPFDDFVAARNSGHYQILKEPLIFNIEEDVGEDFPLPLEKHKDVVQAVMYQYEILNKTLPEKSVRLFDLQYTSVGLIPCCNPPYCFCNYTVKKKWNQCTQLFRFVALVLSWRKSQTRDLTGCGEGGGNSEGEWHIGGVTSQRGSDMSEGGDTSVVGWQVKRGWHFPREGNISTWDLTGNGGVGGDKQRS